MAKDYKKEFRDFYLPKSKPMIIDIPEIPFVAVEGKGNPNEENGEYQIALGALYGIQYTIKMSKMGKKSLKGYFDYVVPPLEGFWWLDKGDTYSSKSKYNWLSVIRLPEFVTSDIFTWACEEVQKTKGIDTNNAKFIKIKEGLCVQCMHIGSYDNEPKTLKLMEDFINENNLKNDINEKRRHHEIYLNDPKKTEKSKLKTVLRIPVKRI